MLIQMHDNFLKKQISPKNIIHTKDNTLTVTCLSTSNIYKVICKGNLQVLCKGSRYKYLVVDWEFTLVRTWHPNMITVPFIRVVMRMRKRSFFRIIFVLKPSIHKPWWTSTRYETLVSIQQTNKIYQDKILNEKSINTCIGSLMIWCEIWHFVLQIVSWSIIKGMQHQKQDGNYQTAADKGDNKCSTVQIVSKQVIY